MRPGQTSRRADVLGRGGVDRAHARKTKFARRLAAVEGEARAEGQEREASHGLESATDAGATALFAFDGAQILRWRIDGP